MNLAMSQESQTCEPDLVVCSSRDLPSLGYGAQGPEAHALAQLRATHLDIRSSPPRLEHCMGECVASTTDATVRGLLVGSFDERTGLAVGEQLHGNHCVCTNHRTIRNSHALPYDVSTVNAASARQPQVNRNQNSTTQVVRGEGIPPAEGDGSMYSLALHHLTEAQTLNLLHRLSEDNMSVQRLPPWYSPPPRVSHEEHSWSSGVCSGEAGVPALPAATSRPDLVLNTPLTTGLLHSDLPEVLQRRHRHWPRDRHQFFSRNLPRYLVQHSPDSTSVW